MIRIGKIIFWAIILTYLIANYRFDRFMLLWYMGCKFIILGTTGLEVQYDLTIGVINKQPKVPDIIPESKLDYNKD